MVDKKKCLKGHLMSSHLTGFNKHPIEKEKTPISTGQIFYTCYTNNNLEMCLFQWHQNVAREIHNNNTDLNFLKKTNC